MARRSLSTNRFAAAFQRDTGVFELAAAFQLFDPGHPGLQALLGPLRRAHGLLVVFFLAAQQKYELAHDGPWTSGGVTAGQLFYGSFTSRTSTSLSPKMAA